MAEKKQNKYSWLIFGLIWGVLMVLIMGVFEPMYYDTPITADTLRHDILLWLPLGIVIGFVQRIITNRKNKNSK
jgi:uncharacterized membrane protein YeaQ/YmgE (transglycosylase-associated protein family)